MEKSRYRVMCEYVRGYVISLFIRKKSVGSTIGSCLDIFSGGVFTERERGGGPPANDRWAERDSSRSDGRSSRGPSEEPRGGDWGRMGRSGGGAGPGAGPGGNRPPPRRNFDDMPNSRPGNYRLS